MAHCRRDLTISWCRRLCVCSNFLGSSNIHKFCLQLLPQLYVIKNKRELGSTFPEEANTTDASLLFFRRWQQVSCKVDRLRYRGPTLFRDLGLATSAWRFLFSWLFPRSISIRVEENGEGSKRKLYFWSSLSIGAVQYQMDTKQQWLFFCYKASKGNGK